MSTIITAEESAKLSLGKFINDAFESGLSLETGVKFRVQSVCGCVTTFAVQMLSSDSKLCMGDGAPPASDPKEIN